jgi:hypothetical protein
VPLHRGNQSGIVSRLAGNAVRDNQLFPRFQNAALVAQRRKQRFEVRELRLSGFDRKAKSVLLDRPRGDDPEFLNDLRNNPHFMLTVAEGFDSPNCDAMHGMARLR